MNDRAWWGVLMGAWIIAALPFICLYTVRAMTSPQAAWERGFTRFSVIWSAGFIPLFLPWSLEMPVGAGIGWTALYAAALAIWWKVR